jgi:hypothetical protein
VPPTAGVVRWNDRVRVFHRNRRAALAVLVACVTVTLPSGCALALLPAREAEGERAERPLDLSGIAPHLAPGLTPRPVVPGPRVLGWEVGDNGVLLRVAVNEGYDRGEIVSFDREGWVVRLADTSVFGTKEDYTTWRLDRAGLRRVLRAFDELGVREAKPGDFGDPAVGPGNWHVGVGWSEGVSRGSEGSVPAYDESPDLPGHALWTLANDVIDPAWHGEHVVVPPRPWVPDAVGVLAGPPDVAAAPKSDLPFAHWPLRRSITELSEGVEEGPYGPDERLCLRGRAAARVFALLEPGVNTAWLKLDDGRRWMADVDVVLPAYSSARNPCGAG